MKIERAGSSIRLSYFQGSAILRASDLLNVQLMMSLKWNPPTVLKSMFPKHVFLKFLILHSASGDFTLKNTDRGFSILLEWLAELGFNVLDKAEQSKSLPYIRINVERGNVPSK